MTFINPTVLQYIIEQMNYTSNKILISMYVMK